MLPSIFDEDESPATSDALLRASLRPRVGLAPPASLLSVPSNLDPSILDYDSFVANSDSTPASTSGPTETRQPARYIGGLVAKAGERKKATEVVFERKLAREREAEDALYGEKEKFVTSAYAATLDEKRLLVERDEKEKSASGGGKGVLIDDSGSNKSVFAASFRPPPSLSSFNGLGSGSSSGSDSDNTFGTQAITNPKGVGGSKPLDEGPGSGNTAPMVEPMPYPTNKMAPPSVEGSAFCGSTMKEVEEARRKAIGRFQVSLH